MKNNKLPLVSFIVPVYNVEKYIAVCIESIINQKEDNYELILVDDGSTDNSLNTCKSYAKKNNKIRVVHKSNGGLVSARKYGLKYAKGEYIACIDGDDWIENNYLSVINNILKKGNPDIIGFNFKKVGRNKEKPMLYFRNNEYNKEKIEKEIYPELIQNKFGKYFSPSLVNKLIRKDIYEIAQNSVSNKISVGEDFACLVPCVIKASSMVTINESLYCYRQNNDSLTKSKKPFDWKYPETMEKSIIKFTKSNNLFKGQLDRKIVHELYSVVFSQFYTNDNYKNIVRKINDILKYDRYDVALKEAKFESIKFSIVQHLLRKRIILPFKLVSIIKEITFKYE